MNNLSWAIYISGVLDGLEGLLLVLGAVSFLGSILITGIVSIGVIDEEFKPKTLWLNLTHLIWIFIAVINIALPSKDTFQMIVASEFAESGLEKFVELAEDEKSIVSKGLKKIESLLEVKEEGDIEADKIK